MKRQRAEATIRVVLALTSPLKKLPTAPLTTNGVVCADPDAKGRPGSRSPLYRRARSELV
jgi:hypothetical protein